MGHVAHLTINEPLHPTCTSVHLTTRLKVQVTSNQQRPRLLLVGATSSDNWIHVLAPTYAGHAKEWPRQLKSGRLFLIFHMTPEHPGFGITFSQCHWNMHSALHSVQCTPIFMFENTTGIPWAPSLVRTISQKRSLTLMFISYVSVASVRCRP